jgi:hypothetical protein
MDPFYEHPFYEHPELPSRSLQRRRIELLQEQDIESVVLVAEGGIHLPILQWGEREKRMPLGLSNMQDCCFKRPSLHSQMGER